MHAIASRNPVVLVHGIDDTSEVFDAMATYLRSQNWAVHPVDLRPCCGRAGLDTLAEQLQSFVEQTFAPDQPIDLVGFSMGGIVSRYYIQRLGGLERVQRFVTLSSPHNGTWTAYFRQNLGASQMRPSSMFLEELNRDIEMLCRVNFTSMWTPYDLMIVPSHSSRLPVGREIMLSVPTHSWMIRSMQSLQRLTEVLQEPPIVVAARDR
jgi:triacylglycerol lipase